MYNILNVVGSTLLYLIHPCTTSEIKGRTTLICIMQRFDDGVFFIVCLFVFYVSFVFVICWFDLLCL